MPEQPQRLTFPAPRRCSVATPNGWYTKPYDTYDVALTKLAGGWFIPHYHDFANSDAMKLAGLGTSRRETKLDKLMAEFHNLPEEMQEDLLNQLQGEQL